jgi:hypothetical protein
VRPTDIGFTSKGTARASDALPVVATLGSGGGRLFLRFSFLLPAGASLVEAYVVLRRASVVDDDPTTLSIHASRVVDAWKGGAVPWALQPRVSDIRLPVTTVSPGGSTLVRLDVRELVRNWARRDPSDQGIAIVAEGGSGAGTTFALSGLGVEADRGPVPDSEPYLELYVR